MPSYGEKSDSIKSIQEILSISGIYPKSSVDSIYGPNTERALNDYIEAYKLEQSGIISILNKNALDYRTVDDLGKVKLRSGNKSRYTMRKTSNKVIVIHWTAGPTTAKSLYDMFSSTERAVSTHFAIDTTGTYQYIPSSRRAYHASWINAHSIGIDICQPVQSSRMDAAIKSGYNTEIVQNASGRGEGKVLKLDDRIAKSTAELLHILCDIHNISPSFPDSEKVVFNNSEELGDWSGIVGHHHVSAMKWDVAPWMSKIKAEFNKIKK